MDMDFNMNPRLGQSATSTLNTLVWVDRPVRVRHKTYTLCNRLLVSLLAFLVCTSVLVPTALATTVTTATVVQQIPGSSISPNSPDPAGIAWASDLQRLVMVDSEINAYPYYAGVNAWYLDLNGNVSTPGTGTTLIWSQEPTGISYDVANQRVFVSDDDRRSIFEVAFGADSFFGTADDVFREFDTSWYGSMDPEDLFYDVVNQRLFIIDGGSREVFILHAGANGIIDGSGDDIFTNFDVQAAGVLDPEGIAYDSSTGTLTVIDYRRQIASEFTVNGSHVRDIELLGAGLVSPSGGTWAPSSTGMGQSLWVTDRGLDGPLSIDGQLVEFSVPDYAPVDPEADIFVTPGAVSFGAVPLGVTGSASVLITNVGSLPLNVTGVSLSGAGEFSILSGGGPVSLNPGDTRLVTLRFAPTLVDTFAGSLLVSSDDSDEPTVAVSLGGSGFVPTGSVALASLVSGGSTTSTTVSAIATVVPGDAYVITVASKPHNSVTGVVGLGGTWSRVDAQCGARSQTGVSVWISTDAVSSGTVTATTLSASWNAIMTVAGYSGVNLENPVGTVVSANTSGVDGACSGGSDTASYSLGLATTAPGSLVVGALAERQRLHNEGPGWTEVFEGSQGFGGSTAGVVLVEQTVASPSAVTLSGSFNGIVDWAAVAFELTAGGALDPIDVPGVTGQEQATAESNLVAAGLAVGTVTTMRSQTVQEGQVISQDPAACSACVAPGTAVNLVVSSGPPGGC